MPAEERPRRPAGALVLALLAVLLLAVAGLGLRGVRPESGPDPVHQRAARPLGAGVLLPLADIRRIGSYGRWVATAGGTNEDDPCPAPRGTPPPPAQVLARYTSLSAGIELGLVVSGYPSAATARRAFESLAERCAAAGLAPRPGTTTQAGADYPTLTAGTSPQRDRGTPRRVVGVALVADRLVWLVLQGGLSLAAVGDGGSAETAVLGGLGPAIARAR